MKIAPRRKGLAISIALAVLLLGVAVYSATTDILLSGTIPDSQVFNGPANVTVRILTLKPGDKLPWHYHPGYAFNVVKSGTLTVEDGCGSQKTLTPGQGFEEIDGRVHRGRNLSNADVVVYDCFLIPQDKQTTMTFPDEEPRCGPPLETDECKSDGWRKFSHPRSFADESQCLSVVRTSRSQRFQF
jgi:quercetin dioxygenase-like cupin family protein